MTVASYGPPPYEPKKPTKKAKAKKPAPRLAPKRRPPMVPPRPAPVSKPVPKPSPAQRPTPGPVSDRRVREVLSVNPPVPKPGPVSPLIKTKGATFGDLTPEALESIEFWIGRGWADFKGIAVTAHAQVESYPTLKTEVVGDKHIETKDGVPGGSVGIFQWNGVRKAGLFLYARRTGQDPYSRKCQLEWAAYEINTTEKYAGDELAKASTLWEAVRAWMHYERPAGWSKANPTNGSHWHKRLDTAIKLRDNYQRYVNWKVSQGTK